MRKSLILMLNFAACCAILKSRGKPLKTVNLIGYKNNRFGCKQRAVIFYVNRDTDFLKGNSNPYHFYHLPSSKIPFEFWKVNRFR